MPKTYEAPVLRRYGLVAEITASDFKCTPGGDGGFTYWDHPNGLGSPPLHRPVNDSGSAGGYTGPEMVLDLNACRGVTEDEENTYSIV